jgi:GTP cyclohydrolase IA
MESGSLGNIQMNEIVRVDHHSEHSDSQKASLTKLDVERAFRDIFRWIGEDPNRDGLRETPNRMARAFQEYFCGYQQDPEQILRKTFEETDGYDEMVILRAIPFESHCEHHVAPIIGRAWVAYVPDCRVVGISKLARVVDAYAKRLQIQERLTA